MTHKYELYITYITNNLLFHLPEVAPASTPFEFGRSSCSSRVITDVDSFFCCYKYNFFFFLFMMIVFTSFSHTHTLLAIVDRPAFLYFIGHVVFLFSISSSSSSSNYNEYSRIICLVFRSLSRSSRPHTTTTAGITASPNRLFG